MELLLAIGLLVAVAAVALEGVLLYLLLRQHGHSLLAQDTLRVRLTGLEQSIDALARGLPARSAPPPPEPLPPGTPAPEFALPTVDGTTLRLRDLLERRLLLIFFNPDCGFCAQMAPELGRLPDSAAPVLLVSRGDPHDHERLAREHGWRCQLVLDQTGEVVNAYKTHATPTGYLIDQQGQIASPLTIGAEPLLTLATADHTASANGAILDAQEQKQAAATERARNAGLPVRDISESRINRNGLPQGTHAPDFELPDLNGSSHSLSDYHGKRVLLVFSDPNCAPCQQLTPSLTKIHDQHAQNGLEVLMVSKGDPEANREKAREHTVNFPVLLQRGNEVAKAYASFATPVGYLIDEHGTLNSNLAIGAQPILDLVP